MEIVIRFPGTEVFEIIKKTALRVPDNGYWAQSSLISRGKVEFSTFSRKGNWVATTNGRVTILKFNGYRGSFADGSCYGLQTGKLPWEEAEVLEFISSTPDDPPVVYLGSNRFLELPKKGSTGGARVLEPKSE